MIPLLAITPTQLYCLRVFCRIYQRGSGPGHPAPPLFFCVIVAGQTSFILVAQYGMIHCELLPTAIVGWGKFQWYEKILQVDIFPELLLG